MLKKIFIVPVTLLLSLSFIACSPVVEKEPEATPAEMIAEKEPIQLEEPGVEVSEEYVDEAIAFTTYALNSIFTKNETYDNNARRVAVEDIAHPDFLEDINSTVASLDELSEVSVESLEIGDVSILDGFRMNDSDEKQQAFEVDYKLIGKSEGEEFVSEACVIVLVHDGIFKYASIFEKE